MFANTQHILSHSNRTHSANSIRIAHEPTVHKGCCDYTPLQALKECLSKNKTNNEKWEFVIGNEICNWNAMEMAIGFTQSKTNISTSVFSIHNLRSQMLWNRLKECCQRSNIAAFDITREIMQQSAIIISLRRFPIHFLWRMCFQIPHSPQTTLQIIVVQSLKQALCLKTNERIKTQIWEQMHTVYCSVWFENRTECEYYRCINCWQWHVCTRINLPKQFFAKLQISDALSNVIHQWCAFWVFRRKHNLFWFQFGFQKRQKSSHAFFGFPMLIVNDTHCNGFIPFISLCNCENNKWVKRQLRNGIARVWNEWKQSNASLVCFPSFVAPHSMEWNQ